MKCGYTWWARYLHAPPSTKVSSQKQVCVLKKGHTDEDHRSATNVTAPNLKEK